MVVQTQRPVEDFRLEWFYCALLLCLCPELLRKLQKESSRSCMVGPGRETGLGQDWVSALGDIHWNTLLKTKLNRCLSFKFLTTQELCWGEQKKWLSLQKYWEHSEVFTIIGSFLQNAVSFPNAAFGLKSSLSCLIKNNLCLEEPQHLPSINLKLIFTSQSWNQQYIQGVPWI